MLLWLVRHAVAIEREEFDGSDAERPLTSKGRRKFRDFCRRLARRTTMPQSIVTSPLVRAVETASILAKAADLRKSNVHYTDLLSPGVDMRELIRYAGGMPANRIALVGHEPDMSEILAELVGGGAYRFGKGFIAAVEFESSPALHEGRLAWFAGPKLD